MLVLTVGSFIGYHILLAFGHRYRANMVKFFIILMAVLTTVEQAHPAVTRIADGVQEVRQGVNVVQDASKKAGKVAVVAQSVDENAVLNYGSYKPTEPNFLEKIFPILGGGKFVAPVAGTVTQKFDPPNHHGIDIACEIGTPVRSARDGKISTVAFDDKIGNYVIVDHNGAWQTMYCHMDTVSVAKGQHVFKGDVIGTSGNTGWNSTGPHLHFEIRRNGVSNDPQPLLK
jgi:murein DD-endopeptidase MepM/ murein hydrolase activator NlpD